jgi:uncharacterized protein YjbI with pentapeptide repeats
LTPAASSGERRCRIDLAALSFTRLARVTFEDCVLSQTEFLEAHLDHVRFVGCDLRAADLRGARLRKCELRGCRLDGLIGAERLSGASLPWPDIIENAGTWAAALGIEVLEED